MKLALVALLVALAATGAEARQKKHASLAEQEEKRPQPQLSEIVSPADQEVCFSPEEPCDLKLLKFVDDAQTSIDVAIYDVNLGRFVDKLIEKAKKIQVRILVDKRQSQGPRSAVRRLILAGADVRFGKQKGIMHNKFVVVDGARVETGSFNFTLHAARENNENQVYLHAQPIADRYKKRFEHLWTQASAPKKKFTP